MSRNPGFIIQLDGAFDIPAEDLSESEADVNKATDEFDGYKSEDDFRIVFEDSDFATTPKKVSCDSNKACPSKAVPSNDHPSKAGPSKAVPSKAGPSKAIPSNAGPSKAGPSKKVPAKAKNGSASKKKSAPVVKKAMPKGRKKPAGRKAAVVNESPSDLGMLNKKLEGDNPIKCIGTDPYDFPDAPGFKDMIDESKKKYIGTWFEFLRAYDITLGNPAKFGQVYHFIESKYCGKFAGSTISSIYSHLNMGMNKTYHRHLGERKDIFK